MSKIKFNEKDKDLTPKARLLIAEVGNKVNRRFLSSFKVLEIEKIRIEDIEMGCRNMCYEPFEISEPQFCKNTPIEIQQLVINAYLFQKENNGFLYNTMMDVDTLIAADCQRTLELNRVTQIAKEFNPNFFTPVQLVYVDDDCKLIVWAGQHHAAAAKMLGIKKIPVVISFGKTKEQVANDFIDEDTLKKRLNEVAKCDAGIQAKRIDYLTLERVCNLFRIKLAGSTAAYPKTVNSIRAVRRIVADYGENGLKFAFQMLIDAGWEKQVNAYEETVINIAYGALEIIRNNKGDFNYNKFIRDISQYDAKDCVDMMNTAIGTFAVKKHPELSPAIYIAQTYGK